MRRLNLNRNSLSVKGLNVDWLEGCMSASINAAMPANCLSRFSSSAAGADVMKGLASAPSLAAFGAGKASEGFAVAAHRALGNGGEMILNGPANFESGKISVRKCSHPLPDSETVKRSHEIMDHVEQLGKDDTVLFLLSGGASSMFAVPDKCSTLEEKVEVCSALISSGASISELNCVRRHISSVKGGRLASAAYPARVVTLAISDVPTGSIHDIGSGPTVPDPTSCDDALSVLKRHTLDKHLSVKMLGRLQSGQSESVKQGDRKIGRSECYVIGSNRDAVREFAAASRHLGVSAFEVEAPIKGKAEDAARSLIADGRRRVKGRGVLVAGGEVTVNIPVGLDARGGRCQHMALYSSGILREGEMLVAFGTDGRDGKSNLAGGIGLPDKSGRSYIAQFESERFLLERGRALETGATGTNVSDLYIYMKTA